MMNYPSKPEKKERKRKIKDHNAKRKASLKQRRRDLTPEERAEFDRQIRGFVKMLEGIMLIAGVDLDAMVKDYHFPSEIDVDGKGEGKPNG